MTRIEKLGTREIAGLLVYGTRVTRTSPESKPDSEHLVWSYESWYSPELQMDVLSMIDPPWSGRTIRRLVNIQRIEPEAALFEIPEGYTMQRPRGDSGQGGRAAQENLSNERPQAPTP